MSVQYLKTLDTNHLHELVFVAKHVTLVKKNIRQHRDTNNKVTPTKRAQSGLQNLPTFGPCVTLVASVQAYCSSRPQEVD